MIAFPDLKGCKEFPYPEGYQFEFKATASALCTEKLLATICGFLNNEGGYFIVGIDDNRKIVGVNQNKELDKFLGRVDAIYHDRMIVHEDGSQISVETIKVLNVSIEKEKVVCVVQAIPEPDKKYRFASGDSYYRLSSSNLRLSSGKFIVTMSQLEIDALVFNKTNSIKNEYESKLKTIKIDYDCVIKRATGIQKSYDLQNAFLKKQMEKEKQTTEMLFDLILKQKKEKEEELYGKKCEEPVKGNDLNSYGLCCLLL